MAALIARLKARLTVWVIRQCWALLTQLDARCPVCATPVTLARASATKVCSVCGQPVLGSVLRQHDGRVLCDRHKAGL